jgi:hypothetical protein
VIINIMIAKFFDRGNDDFTYLFFCGAGD